MSAELPPSDPSSALGDETIFPGAPAYQGDSALPVGHRVQEYVIEGLVGEGGFGIVYLARDTQLGRVVALKEFMPASLATRNASSEVVVRSPRYRETFQLGLRSFVNEAQLLAAFDHPSLVKVYRFWEQNGTAYMVMPFYEGPTLKQWLIEHDKPDEAWLLQVLEPLLDALELMHHERCYHRDIAPDNILLLNQPATQLGRPHTLRPVLLDFGAARRVISDATQALTVILKAGYAPIEQYAESTSMKQGAWTDVYALCAVLYAAISGRAPVPSVGRMVEDDLTPASQVGAGRYSPRLLAAIDAGLAVRPEKRPQSMAALRALFFDTDAASDGKAPQAKLGSAGGAPWALASGAAGTNGGRPWMATALRAGLWLGGGAAVFLFGTVAWWYATREPTSDVVAVVPEGAASSVSGVPTSASASATTAASAAAVTALPPPAASASAVLDVPFSIVTAMQDIARHSNPLLGVNALADKSSVVIGRDRLQFRVRSAQNGYLYVFFAGTEKSHMYLLFPNEIDQDNRVDANKELVLPRPGWRITAEGPPGVDHIVAVVSPTPRDFSATGLRSAGGGSTPEFDLQRAEQVWLARSPTASPFVGSAVCGAASGCDASYGATLLEIEEVVKR